MSARGWTAEDIPDLSGRRALVTGVTSGLGEQTVLELARHGAQVLMAARNPDRLADAVRDVRAKQPRADVSPLVVDLADLASVRRAAAEASMYGSLHILVNNAGVMATPRRRTADGFELQMGTNHLGHFALTGLLLPALLSSGDARVVTVSSNAHRLARSVPLKDPRADAGRYQKWLAYGRSKLANLLFAFELERRARAAGLPLRSMAAHPGYAATRLMSTGINLGGRRADGAILAGATRLLAQPPAQGALPLLMAATLPGLPGGVYVGPSGPLEARGLPVLVRPSSAARDHKLAGALWRWSEQATGVAFL